MNNFSTQLAKSSKALSVCCNQLKKKKIKKNVFYFRPVSLLCKFYNYNKHENVQ